MAGHHSAEAKLKEKGIVLPEVSSGWLVAGLISLHYEGDACCFLLRALRAHGKPVMGFWPGPSPAQQGYDHVQKDIQISLGLREINIKIL
jgi:hypothetical protein